MPAEPRSASRSRPSHRSHGASRFAKTIVLLLVAIAGILALLFYLHFRMTPSFADYLRTRPVQPAHLDSLQPDGQVLADADHWAFGTADPFAQDQGAQRPRQVTSFVLDIQRGADVLLHLEQEFAVVMEPGTGQRIGAALRTVQLTTGEGLRARVRVYLHDAESLLDPGAGAATFDVTLAAGDGQDRVEVIAIPAEMLAATEPVHTRPRMSGLLGRLWPLVDLPEEGLLHRVRTRAILSFRRVEGGSQGAALTNIVHAVNTSEYSFDVQAKIKVQGEGGTMTRTLSSQQSFSWNGKLW